MVSQAPKSATPEQLINAWSGWVMLLINIVLIAGGVLLVSATASSNASPPFAIGGMLAFILGVFLTAGYFTLQPNEARVLILFGSYRGTVRDSGFHWANPFYSRTRGRVSDKTATGADGRARMKLPVRTMPGFLGYQALSTKLSLRAQNFNSDTLKVNDKRGNPIEIGAVIVWRVENTAQAVFDVEDYASFVQMQSESAIRSVASRYAYDHGEQHELTLRGAADEVALALKDELHLRLVKA